MKESFMLDYFMNSGLLCADETEKTTQFSENIVKDKQELQKLLDKEQMKRVESYASHLVWHMFAIREEECSKMFHLGIKLGMEIGEFNNQGFEN